jgi:HopA1 effector protein family
MVNVRDQIAALDANASQMSGELRRFLDVVWSNRAKIALSGSGSGGRLYRLYARRPMRDAPNASLQDVMPFLRRLEPISRHPLARPHWIQDFDDYGIDSVTELIECLQDFELAGQLADIAHVINEAANTFYHLPAQAAQPAHARIYLNVQVHWGVDVMGFVVRDLLGMYPDALKAKLAGPRNTGADRIVIWVTGLNRVDGILRAIADYQRTHLAFFIDGTPRLCQQAQVAGVALRGVGLASEPAQQNGVPISFGKSRTLPIFQALDNVLGHRRDWWTLRGPAAEEAKQEFLRATSAELRRAGINPAQIHI